MAVILRDQVEKDRFENGTLIDQTGNRFTISSNTVTELIVDVADVTPQGPQITLIDDDQLQDGQDVPMPDTSELASAMWEAFVNVQFDVGDSNDNVPFVLNIGTIEEQLAAVDWDSKYDCSGSYWVTYVLGCFQPAIEWDNDGEREGEKLGTTLSVIGSSIIFTETIRDFSEEHNADASMREADTVVHEVGHAVSKHTEDGSPNVTRVDENPSAPARYTEGYLRFIRESDKPWSP